MKNALAPLLVLLLGSSFAHGQSAFIQNRMPLGDIEMFMANTGTGIYGSAGGVYYNPASLTGLNGHNIQFAGNAYTGFDFHSEPFMEIDGHEINLYGGGSSIFPSNMVYSFSKGDWTLAGGLIVPASFHYDGNNEYNFRNPGGDYTRVSISQFSTESVFSGVSSVARKLGDHWSVGLSLYGSYFAEESKINFLIFNPDSAVDSRYALLQSDAQAVVGHAVLGLHYHSEKVGVGLRVSTPGIRFWGKGDFHRHTYINQELIQLIVDEREDDTRTTYELPWELRSGFSWQATDKLRWALDVSYAFQHTYYTYTDIEEELVNNPNAWRFSTGLEYDLNSVVLYLGGSYNWDELTGTDNIRPDYFTVTGGLSRVKPNSISSFGFFYTRGSASGPLAIGNGSGNTVYQYYGITLGTTLGFPEKGQAFIDEILD